MFNKELNNLNKLKALMLLKIKWKKMENLLKSLKQTDLNWSPFNFLIY